MRSLYLAGIAYMTMSLFVLTSRTSAPGVAVIPHVIHAAPSTNGGQWFATAKPMCNAVEVEQLHRHRPPPDGLDGAAYSAACFALAGKIDRAREVVMTVDSDKRWKAVGVVFDVGHPIADMGDDLSAGPIMELVVEFWPNHYMALYHAGAARFALGEYQRAKPHLTSFLEHYESSDGWTKAARHMLTEIGR